MLIWVLHVIEAFVLIDGRICKNSNGFWIFNLSEGIDAQDMLRKSNDDVPTKSMPLLYTLSSSRISVVFSMILFRH